jgi:putative sugar O-methyltransferase
MIIRRPILPSKRRKKAAKLRLFRRNLLLQSILFDSEWYLSANPEVAEAGFDPVDHYLQFGAAEGRAPGPGFDPAWYLLRHRDVAAAGVPALLHYLQSGSREGRPIASIEEAKRERQIATGKEISGAMRKEIPDNIRVNFALTRSTLDEFEWLSNDTPDVSIIILSYLRPDLAENLIKSILLFTNRYKYEIIIVDNGSPPGSHALNPIINRKVRVVTLSSNHYIGDAYNIGVENAKGQYVVLMNNDIVVTQNWLSPLIHQLMVNSDIGIVGPKFLYPSGELQEAGAMIAPDGRSIQRGKRGDAEAIEFNKIEEIDYCTGATLALRRDLYIDIGGYDWRWSPGYYEDVDLCFKAKDRGLRIFYVPDSVVFHIESVTMSNSPPTANIGDAIEDNRINLVAKWTHLLDGSRNSGNARITPPDGEFIHLFRGVAQHQNIKPKTLGIFFPYEFIPGGGEKYCLSIAEQFSQDSEIFLIFQDRQSIIRTISVMSDLGFVNLNVHVVTLEEAKELEPFDLFILLGNELLPIRPSMGRIGFYICQFPFPLSHEQLSQFKDDGYYQTFARYIVYSKFVEQRVSERLAAWRVTTPISIVEPPVDIIGPLTESCQNRIIGVGRFFVGGHNKRHDILIEAMRDLVTTVPAASLSLAGAVHKGEVHRSHLRQLRTNAAGLPISFHVDIGRDALVQLYRQSSVFWHAAGWGVDLFAHPEMAEHFGIAVLEAMSAGCIPVVYAAGGPLEIVKHGVNGITVGSIGEMVQWTARILENWDTPFIRKMRQLAIETADRYNKAAFGKRVHAVMEFGEASTNPSKGELASAPLQRWQFDHSHPVVRRSRIIREWHESMPTDVKRSSFWRDLGDENLRQLDAHGVLNFKRSVNQNYFSWPVETASDSQMRKLLSVWAQDPELLPLEAELLGSAELGAAVENRHILSNTAARAYTLFVGLLWWYATRNDSEGLAARVSEPELGNPIDIRLGERRVSQDLANSFREWQRISPYVKNVGSNAEIPVLAEIGAGYGRLATVVLEAKQCRYWVFDISPALALSEWYLSTTFPGKRVFRWRPFSRWQEIEEELANADLAFFSIDQLSLIPDESIAVFVAISVLQEMLPEDRAGSMRLMAAKATNALYTKNWTRWSNVWDNLVFNSSEIQAPEGWTVVFDRQDDVLEAFTEKLFVRNNFSTEMSC